jgi:hypothetical protein
MKRVCPVPPLTLTRDAGYALKILPLKCFLVNARLLNLESLVFYGRVSIVNIASKTDG